MIKLKMDSYDFAHFVSSMSEQANEAKVRASFAEESLDCISGRLACAETDRDAFKRESDWKQSEIDRLRALIQTNKSEMFDLHQELRDLRARLGIPSKLPLGFSQSRYDEVLGLMREGNKILAIKVVREVTGLGLKESKDLVEDGKTFVWAAHQDRPAINPPSMGGPIPPVSTNPVAPFIMGRVDEQSRS